MSVTKAGVQQADGGYRFLSPQTLLMRQQMLALPAVTRCAFCAESFTGSAAAGMVWHAEHRQAAHPGASDRGQRSRRTAARNAPRVYGNLLQGGEV